MDPKMVQQFPKGSMEMALLCLIAQGETYGYEILMKLNESAQVLGYARDGAVYPIPYRLEEARLIASGRTPARTKWGSNDLFAHAAGAGGAGRNEKASGAGMSPAWTDILPNGKDERKKKESICGK